MFVQKFYDGVLTEIDLEAVFLDLNLLWCETPLDFYSPEFRDHVRLRPPLTPAALLGIAIVRSIDRHPLVLESDRCQAHYNVMPTVR